MSRGASVRLFAAIDPPPELGEELLRWARSSLRARGLRARVIAPESLHVTLMFLGERPADEIEDLADALAASTEGAAACELETGAPVWLPPRRPRALAVEVQGGDALARLQRRVAEALCAVAGLPVPRRFRAHLTVARTKGDPPLEPPPPTPSLRFTAEEVVLYRSHLDPGAARYERLEGAPLMG